MLALHRAADAPIAVETDSVEAYWVSSRRFGTVAEWEKHVEKLAALMVGDAILRLPDTTRWIYSGGLLLQSDGIHEGAGDNRFLQRLVALLLRHQRLRAHSGPSPLNGHVRLTTGDGRRRRG